MVDRIVSSWIYTEMERKERADSEIYGIKSERVVFTSALLLFIYSKNALAYYTTTQPTPLIKAAPPRKIYDFEVIGERRMWN